MSKVLLSPPRLAEKILRRMSLYEDDFLWTGDLEEEFRARAVEAVPKRARIWYLSQLLRAFPAYTQYLGYWSCVMLKNYFITALRNLRRRKVLSFLNLSGLALGITCFMLISLYVQSELDFDRFHQDVDRIYRVCSEHPFVYHGKNQSAITPAPLAPALKQDLPEVLNSVRFTDANNVLLSANEKVFLEDSVFFASPEIFEVFSFPLLAGDPAGALSSSPYSMVISERMAQKYFDEENPLGRTIRYGQDQDFKITGILRDIPENSHIKAEFIVPFKTYGLLNDRVDFSSWSQSEFYTYIKVREDTDRARLEGKLQPYQERSFMPSQESKGYRYFLQPMTKIHLYSDLIGEIGPNNNIRNIVVFAFIAFLILVIACINYMNLVTASSTQRGREVGIRKVVGAGRKQVVGQFFGESLMMVLLALLLACLLVYLLLPSFNAFVERDLRFDLIEAPQLLFRLAILLVAVGILAGCYPALILSSFRPSAWWQYLLPAWVSSAWPCSPQSKGPRRLGSGRYWGPQYPESLHCCPGSSSSGCWLRTCWPGLSHTW